MTVALKVSEMSACIGCILGTTLSLSCLNELIFHHNGMYYWAYHVIAKSSHVYQISLPGHKMKNARHGMSNSMILLSLHWWRDLVMCDTVDIRSSSHPCLGGRIFICKELLSYQNIIKTPALWEDYSFNWILDYMMRIGAAILPTNQGYI